MTINISVGTIEAGGIADIPLNIDATADAGDTLTSVTVKGLPQGARLSAGARQADGSWIVAAADVANVTVTFDQPPSGPVALDFEATGTSAAGAAVTAAASATAEVKLPPTRGAIFSHAVAAIVLVLFSAAVFICWRNLYRDAQDVLTSHWVVPWTQPADVLLKSGPITFWYDKQNGKLHHRGPIDAKLKQEILNLAYVVPPPVKKDANAAGGAGAGDTAEAAGEGGGAGASNGASPTREAAGDPRLSSYVAAVDRLAFASNELISKYFIYLLSLAGLSGMLGTQIRAFANFIYVSTTRNDLNIRVWWPWYALRPVLGFLLGLMAVLLVEGKLFVPATDSPPSGTAWWMALAMLVGFAADDFAQRLRLVGQALFGKESK